MRKKIAVITTGSIFDRKGFFNAVQNRTKYLLKITDFDIDVYIICYYESWIIRKLRKTKKEKKINCTIIDGIRYNIIWRNFSMLNYLLTYKFHYKNISNINFIKKTAKRFKEYNFVIAHSLFCGQIAKASKEIYGIPYSVTWHGSDIHTLPFKNNYTFIKTKEIIEDANINLFVSKNLKKQSELITQKGKKDVLYNGCNNNFMIYGETTRASLKKQFNTEGKKVVTFMGNFLLVKNILEIPKIFKLIYEKEKNIVFWMIGDGKFKRKVEELIDKIPVVLWGNQPPDRIPLFLNCTDVLILPSLNEGLPLSVVEALKCGCHVVGSRVGGIPEILKIEDTIPLDSSSFSEDFTKRVLFYLKESSDCKQSLSSIFDWNNTAIKEKMIIENIIE